MAYDYLGKLIEFFVPKETIKINGRKQHCMTSSLSNHMVCESDQIFTDAAWFFLLFDINLRLGAK
jgi:hypothetical protein